MRLSRRFRPNVWLHLNIVKQCIQAIMPQFFMSGHVEPFKENTTIKKMENGPQTKFKGKFIFQRDADFFRKGTMNIPLSDIAFTPSVKSIQTRLGSRQQFAQMENRRGWSNSITQELAAFLAEQDSFFLGTASAEGRPYIQHRGGPKGFLKVLDDQTLAFADFSGNPNTLLLEILLKMRRLLFLSLTMPAGHALNSGGRHK